MADSRNHPAADAEAELQAARRELLELRAALDQYAREAGSARKQAEEGAAQLAAMVEASADAIVGTDLQGVITSWNGGAERIFGYAAAEIMGKSLARLEPPGRPGEVRKIIEQVVRGNERQYCETARMRHDGTTLATVVMVSPIRDAAGRVVGVSHVARDVTAERMTQQALTASELRYRRLFETAKDGILILDADSGMVVDVNPFLISLLGYSRAQFLGKAIWDLGFFRDVVANADKFAELRATEYVRYENMPLETADGRQIAVEFISNVYLVDGGKVIQCNVRDVSARQKADEDLRASEARFRRLVENIREVFWMTDVAKTRVDYISPGYEVIWGRSCASLYADLSTWTDSIHADDRGRVLAQASSQQALGNYDETYRILRPDGSCRWVHDRAFPVKNAAGQVTGVVGVAEDVTERKISEEQSLRAQRIEAIGTLAGGIAHDLNNILAPMLMVAPLLKEKMHNAHDIELLTMVEQGAQRGANIIRQLLTFSRGIAGERGPVQVRHLLREMITIVRETFPREITLVDNLPSDLWITTADATQIHQVLMNLCVNARDAMPRGGRLTLSARNEVLCEQDVAQHPPAKPGPYLRVTVDDTGQGIPAANLGRIFEPFFTTKEIGKGTGLGLSTVSGIVKSHGGFVTVMSTVGRGSQFEVHLPAVADAMEIQAAQAGMPILGHAEMILVVDDEPAIRRAVRRILEGRNYRVLTAADGVEASAVYGAHAAEVRLVITDIMMPAMSGLELIHRLRATAPQLPIIAMTGLHDQDCGEELVALNLSGIIAKPFPTQEILAGVQRALAAR